MYNVIVIVTCAMDSKYKKNGDFNFLITKYLLNCTFYQYLNPQKNSDTIYFSPIKIDGKLIQVCVYINLFYSLSFPYALLSFTCNLLYSLVKTIL